MRHGLAAFAALLTLAGCARPYAGGGGAPARPMWSVNAAQAAQCQMQAGQVRVATMRFGMVNSIIAEQQAHEECLAAAHYANEVQARVEWCELVTQREGQRPDGC